MGGGLVHKKISVPAYADIISVENLLLAWREFKTGKEKKKDVQEFRLRLMDNILALHEELKNKTYQHGGYHHFRISDPKPRNIHKASVWDRLVHHAIYRILYLYFDRTFIADSYSCRIKKGTHKALNRFRGFSYKVSRNNTRTCWVLKCDIRKFFANIDHQILVAILKRYIFDSSIFNLLTNIISSFSTQTSNAPIRACMTCHTCTGLPLGNLTSQLLVNIYMNEFDQFVKHEIKAKYYIRYADDFVFLSDDLVSLRPMFRRFEIFLKHIYAWSSIPISFFLKLLPRVLIFLAGCTFPTTGCCGPRLRRE